MEAGTDVSVRPPLNYTNFGPSCVALSRRLRKEIGELTPAMSPRVPVLGCLAGVFTVFCVVHIHVPYTYGTFTQPRRLRAYEAAYHQLSGMSDQIVL